MQPVHTFQVSSIFGPKIEYENWTESSNQNFGHFTTSDCNWFRVFETWLRLVEPLSGKQKPEKLPFALLAKQNENENGIKAIIPNKSKSLAKSNSSWTYKDELHLFDVPWW